MRSLTQIAVRPQRGNSVIAIFTAHYPTCILYFTCFLVFIINSVFFHCIVNPLAVVSLQGKDNLVNWLSSLSSTNH